MKLSFSLPRILSVLVGLLLASCSSGKKTPTPNPDEKVVKAAEKVNPHPPGTYEHFKFDKYPYTTRTWKNEDVLATANSSNTQIKINLGIQRAFLMVGDQIAMDYRISTGSSSRKTPIGSFKITEKIKDKRSNLYGSMLNSSGGVVKSNADARKDKVPSGGRFRGAAMTYWMRLTATGIGMHKGNVNNRYASHGCIRSHYSAVPIVFSKTRVGTPVTITP